MVGRARCESLPPGADYHDKISSRAWHPDYYDEIACLETRLLRSVVLDDAKARAPRADLINTKHAYGCARGYREAS